MNFPGPPLIMGRGMSGLGVRIDANGPTMLVGIDLEEYWWKCGCSGVPPQANLRFILILTRGER